MSKRVFHLISAMLFSLAMLSPHAIAQTASQSADPSAPHMLVPADVVMFRVLNQPELGMEVRVNESGQIRFPYAGTLNVEGLTLDEAAARLGRRLERQGILSDAEIVGSILSFGTNATILGAVNAPGAYALDRPTRLTQFLARAGGPSTLAGSTITLRRTAPDGSDTIREIHLPTLLEGKRPDENFIVRNNDEFYIPEAPVFYLYGNVNNPGAYPMRRPLTVQQALSAGGGISQIGSESRIRIQRQTDAGTVEMETGLHDRVQPFDTIEVPERFF